MLGFESERAFQWISKLDKTLRLINKKTRLLLKSSAKVVDFIKSGNISF